MNEFCISHGNFTGGDAKKIFFRFSKRRNEKGKAVVILHGACEHSGRYLSLIKFLWERGYTVFAPDLRGHGKSEGRRVHINNFSEYLIDLKQMIDLIRTFGWRHIHILGHSMGGLIAVRYVQEYRQPDIVSLILSSPLFGWKEMPRIKIFGGRIISKVWPTFLFQNPVDETLLSHDESVIQKYHQDKLVCNAGTARLGAELTKNFAIAFKKAKVVKTPTLLLIGGADKIADPEASKRFFEKVNSCHKNEYIFPEMYHEIFNEIGKEKPLAYLADWLKRLDG